jgi:hypothetical protein
MSRPIVALLTDFGLRDHYVAAMKAVVLGLCPDVQLVDITHEVSPQDIVHAALSLRACYRDFPAGTIFLVVVDPGVGSARRVLAVETASVRFVFPDNGVLDPLLAEDPPRLVVEVTNEQYGRPRVSRTFEGRDRFAPAAGWLASGVEVRALGARAEWRPRLAIPRPALHADRIEGEVIHVDRFGNLITNITRADLEAVARTRTPRVIVGTHQVAPLVSTYSEAKPGCALALVGSSETLEISLNGGSAAEALGLGRGAIVRVDYDGPAG